jgi:hypothetical protein
MVGDASIRVASSPFQPSLRDEFFAAFRKPWIETHGYYHNAATRRGLYGTMFAIFLRKKKPRLAGKASRGSRSF